MRYVRAKYNLYTEAYTYRVYVCDSIFNYLDGGKRLSIKYTDVLKPRPIDNRTGDEIALDVMARAGLSFGKEA